MLSAIIYFLLLAALLLAFLFLSKQRSTRKFGIIVLSLALALEIFVCNFHSFALLAGGYSKTAVDLQATNVTLVQKSEEKITLEVRDLNQPIGTLHLQCELPGVTDEDFGTPYVKVSVDACDATQQSYYRSNVAEGQIVRGDSRSAYLVLNLSGNVTSLRIRLTAPDGCRLTLSGVTMNEAIPMHFSPLRLLLFVGILTGIRAMLTLPSMLAGYEDKRLYCRRAVLGITAVLILFAVGTTFIGQYDRIGGISSGFLQTSGNQITKELVDAFEAGRLTLDGVPPDELLELNNPYDWSERISAGVTYKWDHLLFEGKYYSYYGVAPVFLLFLPYHLITGYYFPSPEAVLIFGTLGMLFLSLLYLEFCDLFAKKLPVNMVLAGLLVCQLASGVWYNFASPLFYEIAQTSGFLFTCAGFYFLLRSNVIGDRGAVRLPSVALSSLCLSLAVLSRPTLALYCIAALFFLFFGFRKHRQQSDLKFAADRKQKNLASVRYLLAALLPFVLLGGFQMWYNYARFGSILDFGIQYSLTINDFTRSQYHTDFVTIGIYNFLFAFPSIRPEFPYLFSSYSDLGLNGYYFLATDHAVGLFFRALPMFGWFAFLPAWRSLTKPEKRRSLCLLLPVCLLVPLGILVSIWESGYSVRYATDFAWQMILGAVAILFLLYARRAQPQTRRLLQIFFISSALLALVCNFALIHSYLELSGYLESESLAFARIFDFWR